LTRYKVWMTIAHGFVNQQGSNRCLDIWANTPEEAAKRAVTQAGRIHWDTPRDGFQVDRIEVLE